jgi:hypothetical protein
MTTYTVASLAAEWECSEAVIRKEIAAGRLGHFRIGTLIRIPVEEARRYECQVTPSNDSEVPTPASSETSMAGAAANGSMRPIGLAPKRRRAGGGSGTTVQRGPWAGS